MCFVAHKRIQACVPISNPQNAFHQNHTRCRSNRTPNGRRRIRRRLCHTSENAAAGRGAGQRAALGNHSRLCRQDTHSGPEVYSGQRVARTQGNASTNISSNSLSLHSHVFFFFSLSLDRRPCRRSNIRPLRFVPTVLITNVAVCWNVVFAMTLSRVDCVIRKWIRIDLMFRSSNAFPAATSSLQPTRAPSVASSLLSTRAQFVIRTIRRPEKKFSTALIAESAELELLKPLRIAPNVTCAL